LRDDPTNTADSTKPSAALADETVAVFLAATADFVSPESLASFWRVLSGDERARHDRFHFTKDRQTYLAAHGILRGVLSLFDQANPVEWAFAANSRGKPEIAGRPDLALRFNLSHTAGLISVAVCRRFDVGVDVEQIERGGDIRGLADYCLRDFEKAQLPAGPEADPRPGFCRFWTLKEAYLKAKGVGLAIPLKQFGFRADDPAKIILECDSALHENPADWQFVSTQPTPGHFLGLAVRAGGSFPLKISLQQLGPGDLEPLLRGAGKSLCI
jgi:4'-phosphopantetheinyl transferase